MRSSPPWGGGYASALPLVTGAELCAGGACLAQCWRAGQRRIQLLATLALSPAETKRRAREPHSPPGKKMQAVLFSRLVKHVLCCPLGPLRPMRDARQTNRARRKAVRRQVNPARPQRGGKKSSLRAEGKRGGSSSTGRGSQITSSLDTGMCMQAAQTKAAWKGDRA